MRAYRRALAAGHLAHAATLYPAYVRARNARIAIASGSLYLAAIVIFVHLVTVTLP